jgi:hypothetical protein
LEGLNEAKDLVLTNNGKPIAFSWSPRLLKTPSVEADEAAAGGNCVGEDPCRLARQGKNETTVKEINAVIERVRKARKK